MGRIHPSELCLAALVFVYSLNFGPMMFESFTSDRLWASNPPESFYMFLVGKFGQKTAHYWRIVTPLAVLAFVLTLIVNWQVADRRLWLASAFVVYLGVQASTMAYFVPEQDALVAGADSIPRTLLTWRADRWIFLNYFRNAAGVLAYLLLLRAILVPRLP